MPKKGKVNKLARMSDEERARYLQHRADLEEEARRRKRELIARFIKNKLDKEEAFSRKNTAKLNQNWRYILRKVKCSQMTFDIEGMKNSFDFMMDRKNRLLDSLLKNIEDSNEQHRRAFEAHTENLSFFIGIGSERLEKLQNEYDFQRNSLLETWERDYFDISGNQDKSEFKLQLIIFIQNNEFQNFNKHMQLMFATAKNDARLEHEEEMRALQKPKQLEVEFYWAQLKEVYNQYLEHHSPMINHYNCLREKDSFYQRDIAKNDVLIEQTTESLLVLQKDWLRTTMITDYKLKKLMKKKEQLYKRHWELKQSFKVEQSTNSRRLNIMVNAGQDAITRLQDVKAKLQKILQMAEICAKFENEVDRFLNASKGEKEDDTFENLDNTMTDEYKEYNKIGNFLLKMNRVKVQTMCLKNEKTKLTKENIKLKNYIKRYLTELALHGRENRPLSVKLQSESKKLEGGRVVEGGEYKMRRPVTCIEGVLSNVVLHEKRMNMLDKRNKEKGRIQSFPRVQCWMEA